LAGGEPPSIVRGSFQGVIGDFVSQDIFVSLVEFADDVGAAVHRDCSTSFAAVAESAAINKGMNMAGQSGS
jgi:hypothetical protein